MQNTFNQVQNPSTLLNLIYPLSFWGNYSLEYFFNPSFTQKVDFEEKYGSSKRLITEASLNELYKSQPRMNIILNKTASTGYKKLKVSKITESDEETTKVPRKSTQKQTRNVSSNLMRIFLKNLIQLKNYREKISLILARNGNNITEEHFYKWIQGFTINFKNYIRGSQIAKIIGPQQPEHFRKTFLILLNHFSNEMGLQHCLTSKRIERNSVRMHLQGLRNMNSELAKQFQTKY